MHYSANTGLENIQYLCVHNHIIPSFTSLVGAPQTSTMPTQPPASHRPPLPLCGTNELDITAAATSLRDGNLIAFPTETVYGLGADATSQSSVLKIFAAKNRPADNPLIVHLSSMCDLNRHKITPLPLSPVASRLAAAFWPGPLTLVLPLAVNSRLARAVTAGLSSVAVRVPRHPVAAALLSRADVPVAAPSANASGRPSPTCVAHVVRDLAHAIHAVVDGGDLSVDKQNCGLESTVVDVTVWNRPAILRPGAISQAELETVACVKFVAPDAFVKGDVPKAPGMKYRHYAPRAPLRIVDAGISASVTRLIAEGKRVGVLAEKSVCDSWRHMQGVVTVSCGTGDDSSFARELYAALRAFDGEGDQGVEEGVDVILAVPPRQLGDGIGKAIMNRLQKAANGAQESVNTKS